ncbi:MAG: NAD(P)-dependent oxidoreductase, partial [Rhodospirillales bacterium]|nr:NAD(P)-dependent oxidoreductase [Rhodospirillales bacterium]
MQLITGGMGFIGLHTAKAFLDAGEDVVLTRFRSWRMPGFLEEHLDKRLFVEPLDLTSPHDVIEVARKHKPDAILHLAVPALKHLSAAEEFRTNMDGLINILEAARLAGAKRVTLASSLAVYGGLPGGPFTEEMPLELAPTNPTDAYKKSFEILGQHYAERCGLDVAIARIGGIYGPLYHSMASLACRLAHAAVQGV